MVNNRRVARTVALEEAIKLRAKDGVTPRGAFTRLAVEHGCTRAWVQQVARRVGVHGTRRKSPAEAGAAVVMGVVSGRITDARPNVQVIDRV